MKKYILILLFIHLSITNVSLANDNIAFVDMDKILTNSKVGKSILSQLEILNKKTIDDFKKIEIFDFVMLRLDNIFVLF